jgi:hypothetical protein
MVEVITIAAAGEREMQPTGLSSSNIHKCGIKGLSMSVHGNSDIARDIICMSSKDIQSQTAKILKGSFCVKAMDKSDWREIFEKGFAAFPAHIGGKCDSPSVYSIISRSISFNGGIIKYVLQLYKVNKIFCAVKVAV